MSTNSQVLSAHAAKKAEPVSFAASPVSVQRGRLSFRPSRLFALVGQLVSPCGFWVSARSGDIVLGTASRSARSA